jgi:tRNA (guanine26-N2/guanine27-N2)-dimethyltransferase
VLLARCLAARGTVRVLDLMAGCGIRSVRYGLEGLAGSVWANDADADRLPLLQSNLEALPKRVSATSTAHTAQHLLADLALRRDHYELVDLDAFGSPLALLPAALEAVSLGGVLYLASTDGRSATGHDRVAAARRFGAAARAHPASWELALRLQLGAVARAAWVQGRGIRPLFSFSEGRTFRTAVQLARLPLQGEETCLGLLGHCHGCGDQQIQSLLRLGRWSSCLCGPTSPLAVSGPLWIGPLQDPDTLAAMAAQAEGSPLTLGSAASRLLARLRSDPGIPATCWPTALIGRQLGGGPPRLEDLAIALRDAGYRASSSAVMVGQVRSDAPWAKVLEVARQRAAEQGSESRTLDCGDSSSPAS